MHLYGAGVDKPINSYDVELVAPAGESADNYCKRHHHAAAEYSSYTHVWQPASLESADVAQFRHAGRLVIPTDLPKRLSPNDGKSFAWIHCASIEPLLTELPKRHSPNKGRRFTSVHCANFEPLLTDLPKRLYLNDEDKSFASVHCANVEPLFTDLPTAAAAAAGRHCCRDHVYESPTFDETGLERCAGPLVFPPYYYRQTAGGGGGGESRRAAVMPPPIAETQPQQQQQQGGGASELEAVGESGVAGEWYQPCRTTTTRYEPVVVCTAEPDVTPRPPRTDNHYT